MNTRKLGRSGVEVSAIGFGAMSLSLEDRPSEADAIAVICAALDAGVRLVDTADVYALDESEIGHNERLVAKALREWGGDAHDVVVATKGGIEKPAAAWSRNGSPAHLRMACERSLRSLGTDSIALYQLQVPDPAVPFADTMGELSRLRDEGKIQHVGLSNVSLKEVDQAAAVVPIASVQNRMNPFDLTSWLSGVVQGCAERDIAFVAHTPAGGIRQSDSIVQSGPLNELARSHGTTPQTIGLTWLLWKSPNVIAIPGATRVDSVRSSAFAASLRIRPQDLEALDQALGA
jgi:aryl-alcohol dehydrogenase-like predicted oxidoreductase